MLMATMRQSQRTMETPISSEIQWPCGRHPSAYMRACLSRITLHRIAVPLEYGQGHQ